MAAKFTQAQMEFDSIFKLYDSEGNIYNGNEWYEFAYYANGRFPDMNAKCTINGGEGQGDYIEAILEITLPKAGKVVFMTTGFYNSWAGTVWEEGQWGEAEAYTELVTRYRFKS